MKIPHIPVLLDKIVNYYENIESGYIIDCTLGFAGHSEAILKSNKNIKLIANDQDEEALKFAQKRLEDFQDRVIFNKGNFATVVQQFSNYQISGILADIGVSSLQLDDKSRGFNFDSEILDMRMDKTQTLTAYEVVNFYDRVKLEYILRNYADIKEAKKIVSLIINNRPFQSAKELSSLLEKNLYKTKIHPATLVFQAIRIEVNQELKVLEQLLDSIEIAKPKNCLIGIISFHSLEDRIIKNRFRKWQQDCICPEFIDRCVCDNNHSIGQILTKKPITPTESEIKSNKRSRSSKLRFFRTYQ
jgi:16S rRNA (cytosine1402-N4)-methyltransferase